MSSYTSPWYFQGTELGDHLLSMLIYQRHLKVYSSFWKSRSQRNKLFLPTSSIISCWNVRQWTFQGSHYQYRNSDRLSEITQKFESHLILSFEWQQPLWNCNLWICAFFSLLPPSPLVSSSHYQVLKVIPLSCWKNKWTWPAIFHNNYLTLKQLVIKVILAPWWHMQCDKTEVMWQQQNLSPLFTHCFSALSCQVTDHLLNYQRATELH